MAGHAPPGLEPRFNRVAGEVVTSVDDSSVDGVRLARGDGEGLTLIMALGAGGLAVALVAYCGLSGGRFAVAAQKAEIMAQEGLGYLGRKAAVLVAHEAVACIEVILVALQADGLGRVDRSVLAVIGQPAVALVTAVSDVGLRLVYSVGIGDGTLCLKAHGSLLLGGKPHRAAALVTGDALVHRWKSALLSYG